MKDLVSIITPTYNSEQFVVETIEAILSQSYTNWELLITDDCSTDKTWDILNHYAEKDNRIKIFQLEKNCGGGISRNNSIKQAKGRFIAFCDSDDIWTSDKLELQIKFMLNENISLSYTAYQKMNEQGDLRGIIIPPQRTTFKTLRKQNCIGCLTAVYDVSKIGKVYLPIIRKRQDYGLWLEIHKVIEESKGMVDKPLAFYRVRDNSVSSNKLKAALYYMKVLRQHGDVNFLESIYYFLNYSITGLFKYLK